jgi:hypothetical protein
MDSAGRTALSETPIYDAVIHDQDWSPDALSSPPETEAMIAASYGSLIAKQAVAKAAGRAR